MGALRVAVRTHGAAPIYLQCQPHRHTGQTSYPPRLRSERRPTRHGALPATAPYLSSYLYSDDCLAARLRAWAAYRLAAAPSYSSRAILRALSECASSMISPTSGAWRRVLSSTGSVTSERRCVVAAVGRTYPPRGQPSDLG